MKNVRQNILDEINRRFLNEKNKDVNQRKLLNTVYKEHFHEVLFHILNSKAFSINFKQKFKPSIKKMSIEVPKNFSLIDEPKLSISFIKKIIHIIIFQSTNNLRIDYKKCENIDLGAQIYLDVILKYLFEYIDKLSQLNFDLSLKEVGGDNYRDNPDIQKLLWSVGSKAIHSNSNSNFSDIIPYKLCIRKKSDSNESIKEQDTTELVEYLKKCMKKMNKEITIEVEEDLYTIVGEVLINAEEHSTMSHRYSIGYFQDINDDDQHIGKFNLAILSFGKTLYEKFADPNCENPQSVRLMKDLSDRINKKKLFQNKIFEEETLWTLYTLQEGITSVSKDVNISRGNGSMRFIESFFNLSSQETVKYRKSRMALLSGNAKIVFDGKYKVKEKINSDGERFKVMTFNDSGKIDELPDKNFVSYTDNYFPGTLISAKIIINEDI